MLEAWIDGHVASPMNMFGETSPSSETSESTPTESSGTDLFSLFGDDNNDKPAGSTITNSDDKDDPPPVMTY